MVPEFDPLPVTMREGRGDKGGDGGGCTSKHSSDEFLKRELVWSHLRTGKRRQRSSPGAEEEEGTDMDPV
jgi:hypothetical protein